MGAVVSVSGFAPGDRVRLVEMPNDPCPIEAGSEGTVERVSGPFAKDGTRGFHGYFQLSIAWDSGRTLSCVVPPDRLTVIGWEGEH